MARKPKRSENGPSPAVAEWIRQREAEMKQEGGAPVGGGKPGAAPGPRTGPPPTAPRPSAAPDYNRRRTPRQEAPRASAFAEMWPTIKVILLIVIFGGGLFGGLWYFMQRGGGTPTLGATEINQLKPNMTPEQVNAILGKPQSKRENPGTVRESKVDRIEQAKYYEYFRKGTLMLVYDKDHKLIEVVLGETSEEYYDRKSGEQKALWESYPEFGFIHQDVWRPNAS